MSVEYATCDATFVRCHLTIATSLCTNMIHLVPTMPTSGGIVGRNTLGPYILPDNGGIRLSSNLMCYCRGLIYHALHAKYMISSHGAGSFSRLVNIWAFHLWPTLWMCLSPLLVPA